jgi:hypothetical protein
MVDDEQQQEESTWLLQHVGNMMSGGSMRDLLMYPQLLMGNPLRFALCDMPPLFCILQQRSCCMSYV